MCVAIWAYVARSASVQVYKSVNGVVTLWQRTAIPVSDIQKHTQTTPSCLMHPHYYHLWHLQWPPLTFDRCPKWLWHPSLAVCKLVLCSNTLLISRINRPCEFHTHSGIIKNIKHAQYFITFNAWNKSILQIYTLLVLIYCCYISLSNHSEASGETITHFLQAGCLDLL